METLIKRQIPFAELEILRDECEHSVAKGHSGYLLISEPKATFTYGRAANRAELLWNEADLKEKGIALSKVGRGGRWTYHGPGQMLVYPIFKLQAYGYGNRAVRAYIADVSRGVTGLLAALGIESCIGQCPYGIYSEGKKLVSFGIAVSRGVCSHGLALYLTDQTPNFQGIQPCGDPRGESISLEALGVSVDWDDLSGQMAKFVRESLGYTDKP